MKGKKLGVKVGDGARALIPKALRHPPVLERDWLIKSPPKKKWIVPGFIGANELTILNAQTGRGKSTFLIRLMEGVAAGNDVLGFAINKRYRVLYVMLERSEDSLHRRVNLAFADIRLQNKTLREELDPDEPATLKEFCRNFRAIPLAGERVELIEHEQQQWHIKQRAVGAIIEMIKEHGIDVIIFDTLSRLHGGNHSDPGLAGALTRACEQIIIKTEVAIILVSHGNKDLRGDMFGVAGTAVWINHCSNMIQLRDLTHDELKQKQVIEFKGTQKLEPEDMIVEMEQFKLQDAPRYPVKHFAISHQTGDMWPIGLSTPTPEQRQAKNMTDATGAECVLCEWFNRMDREPFSKTTAVAALQEILDVGRPLAKQGFRDLCDGGVIVSCGKGGKATRGAEVFKLSTEVMAAFDKNLPTRDVPSSGKRHKRSRKRGA